MTTSMKTDDTIDSPKAVGGAIADALTWLRILVMPLVVFLIWKGWQPVEAGGIDVGLTVLASTLFAIGAFTDFFDDFLGGNARSIHRRFGYLDDVADTVLVIGTLLALAFVIHRAGWMTWTFLIPLSNLKSGLSMLATCLLLASPWLQAWIDRLMAGQDNVAEVFATTSPAVWFTGQLILWVAAILSIVTAVRVFRTDFTDVREG